MMKRTYYSAIVLFHVLLAYSAEPDVQKMEQRQAVVQQLEARLRRGERWQAAGIE
jgi:hypothetical protein